MANLELRRAAVWRGSGLPGQAGWAGFQRSHRFKERTLLTWIYVDSFPPGQRAVQPHRPFFSGMFLLIWHLLSSFLQRRPLHLSYSAVFTFRTLHRMFRGADRSHRVQTLFNLWGFTASCEWTAATRSSITVSLFPPSLFPSPWAPPLQLLCSWQYYLQALLRAANAASSSAVVSSS